MLCKLVLIFEFVDENVWCGHSNETSLAVPSLGWDQGPTVSWWGKRAIPVIGCQKISEAMERGKGRPSLGHAFDADNGIML